MAFLPAITGWVREAPGPRATLHASVTGRDGDRRRITFALTRELVEQVGWQGGERFVVSIGVGDDLGAFQLSRAESAAQRHQADPALQCARFPPQPEPAASDPRHRYRGPAR